METFRLVNGDLSGKKRGEAPSKLHNKREMTIRYLCGLALLLALVHRSPRVLAFEWIPLMPVQDDFARLSPRSLCMMIFF